MGLVSGLFQLRNRIFGVNELNARATDRQRDAVERLEAKLTELSTQISELRTHQESLATRADELSTRLSQVRSDYLPDQVWESFDLDLLTRYQAGFTSAEFFNHHLHNKPTFADDLALLSHCAELVADDDLVLEFGSWSGRTLTHLAVQLPTHRVYGFDSFEGLPETWRSDFPEGTFRRDGLPEVPANAELVVGWFDQTLPGFLEDHPGPVGLAHIDCDLYSSSKTVLEILAPRLREGSVLVFDEFFNYPGWERHEYRAFVEFVDLHKWAFSYLGCNPHHQQVAVQLLSTS